MLTPLGYFDLIDEMYNTGCPICNLLTRDVHKLLNTMLYEYVTEPEMHETLRASRGLCNVHGWQLSEQGNALSIATLYAAVVDEVLKEMKRQMSDGKPQKNRVRRMLGKSDHHAMSDALMEKVKCPVCEKNSHNQERFVTVFCGHLDDEKLMSAYRESDGLCLEHFRQVLDQATDVDGIVTLIEMQQHIWRQLKHDLDEFGRKYDVNNADEAMGEERDSWLRAIKQMGGSKGIFGLRDILKK